MSPWLVVLVVWGLLTVAGIAILAWAATHAEISPWEEELSERDKPFVEHEPAVGG